MCCIARYVSLIDSNAKEPLMPHEGPQGPYQKLGSDIFLFEGKNYLLTSCYYSRFFEIDYLPDMRAETVIQKLKVHMARCGICQVLISDNGPSYCCQAFSDFARYPSIRPLCLIIPSRMAKVRSWWAWPRKSLRKIKKVNRILIWAPSNEFVSSSIPS